MQPSPWRPPREKFSTKRIAKATGLSPIITVRDLFEAGIAARIDMAFAPPKPKRRTNQLDVLNRTGPD